MAADGLTRFDLLRFEDAPGAYRLAGRPLARGDAIEVLEASALWRPGRAQGAARIEGRDGVFLVVTLDGGPTVVARLDECRRPARKMN